MELHEALAQGDGAGSIKQQIMNQVAPAGNPKIITEATEAEAVAQRCGAGKAKLAKRRKIKRLGLFHRIGVLGGGKATLAHLGGVIADRFLDTGAKIAVAFDEFRHARR